MMKRLRQLASLRLTLAGMGLLGVGAALSYDNPVSTPIWVLVAPLALLAINLFAAILSNPHINRRGGLLLFHVGLLLIVVLAAVGRLTRMDGRIELTEGVAFAAEDLTEIQRGPWHAGRLARVQFVQGPYTVDYSPGMARGPTRSRVLIPDGAGGWEQRVVGDDTPLVLEGYRFYTTFNKGFAPILSWIPDRGEPVTGSVHMPAYPLFEHRQANRWTPPGTAAEIRFWLQIETGMNPQGAWQLDPVNTAGVLVVRAGERRVELKPGESSRLDGGVLRYERLSSWMGYKLFYDPTLHWLFIASMITVLGLAAHFWRKFGAVQTYTAAQEAAKGKGAGGLGGKAA
jgi:cytochrome c biogenesis protein ResB